MTRFSRSAHVRVDADEVMDDLSDTELLEYLQDRGLKAPKVEDDKELYRAAQLALEYLQRNMPHDAEWVLDRMLHPKWKNPELAVAAYAKVQHS